MLVRDRMTTPVTSVAPKTSIHDALALMKEKGIRRLPVVKGRALVGIVTWTDLMRASPSPATTLSVWEVPYLLMKAPVSEVMTREVITTSPGATVEEVAVLMRQHKIGGVPVVEDGRLVGIITESDVFDAFIDLMGLNRGGVRLTVQLEDRVGALEEVVRVIVQHDVNIRSLAAYVTDGHHHPPRGTRGGGDGAPSIPFKVTRDGAEEPLRPISQEVIQPGELLGHLLSGGGGYGDPFEREPERVRDDVLAGFVSFARAREVYGVAFEREVLDDSLAVDLDETRRLRAAGRSG